MFEGRNFNYFMGSFRYTKLNNFHKAQKNGNFLHEKNEHSYSGSILFFQFKHKKIINYSRLPPAEGSEDPPVDLNLEPFDELFLGFEIGFSNNEVIGAQFIETQTENGADVTYSTKIVIYKSKLAEP